MGTGIIICGLNGAGKSTLGKALAKELGFCFIDIEDLYFPRNDPDYLYAHPRTRKEVEVLLESAVNAHEDFDLAGSRAENLVEDWAASLSCPVIRVDGTKSVVENIKFIIAQIRSEEDR